MNALPEVYDEQAYLDFIDTWGTHFVSKGRMGGISLATYFFHSCFLETSTLYVHQQTSGWGWGLFHHGDSGGDKHLDCMWEKWSTQQGALLGGNATAYAPGGVFPKGMSLTSDQYWVSAIGGSCAIHMVFPTPVASRLGQTALPIALQPSTTNFKI